MRPLRPREARGVAKVKQVADGRARVPTQVGGTRVHVGTPPSSCLLLKFGRMCPKAWLLSFAIFFLSLLSPTHAKHQEVLNGNNIAGVRDKTGLL